MIPRKIILHHALDTGDCVMMTGAIRDLHIAFPEQYITDVRTRFPDLWLHNPYITALTEFEGEHLEIGYPLIQSPGMLTFGDAFRLDLADKLKVTIPWISSCPDIHLTDAEKADNLVEKKLQYAGRYICLNAGYKADVVLKNYPFWQEVVNILKNKVQIIQIGAANDHHPSLENVFSLVGKTTLRELIQIIYRSDMTVGCISLQMVLAAAFHKPSVCVAGGKEQRSWQAQPFHRYLDVIGCLPCCREGGCWKGSYEQCTCRVGGVPQCFAMVPPEEIARNVMLYYEGGVL